MEMDFHRMVMQGHTVSGHTLIVSSHGGAVWELCVSLIYKSTHLIEETPSLQFHHLTKAPPMDAITMGIRMSSCDIPGDTRLRPEGHRRELAPSSSTGCLHAHPTAPSFSASPCNHSVHSNDCGFHKFRSVKCQLHLSSVQFSYPFMSESL